MQNKAKQSYAPFGSVARKSPKKKKNPQLIPGPGAYEVSLPLITPIVQTIRKANNNVIVKLSHLGTAPFLAGGQRFIDRKTKYGIGPGSYGNTARETIDKSEPKRERIYAAEKLRELIKNPIETSPTISEVKKVTFDDDVEMPNIRHKSASKQKQPKNIRGLNWSRMSQQRSLLPNPSSSNLGPGSYELPKPNPNPHSPQKHPSSAFNSNSVRSFFDQIIFETNQDLKARQREERKYKSDVVGPASYDLGEKKERKFRFQFFGSTEERV